VGRRAQSPGEEQPSGHASGRPGVLLPLGDRKEIVGVVEIVRTELTDPKDESGTWAAVEIKPVRKLDRPVTLAEIKADPTLADIELVRLSRLSVAEIRPEEWDKILSMAKA
jgi:predicted RNA-binding protein with PUA-like domain